MSGAVNPNPAPIGVDSMHATIFIVDDEPLVLELAVAILQPLGYDVRTFSDPKEALAEYPAAKPAVVVTDYAMERMTGMDLVRECRRVNPSQKILLISGTVGAEIFDNAAAKPDQFLAKPFQIREFVEVIKLLTQN